MPFLASVTCPKHVSPWTQNMSRNVRDKTMASPYGFDGVLGGIGPFHCT